MAGRGRGRGRTVWPWVVLAVLCAWPSEAEAGMPRESPRYGPPYRRGLIAEVGVGLALCQPALLYGGTCAPRGGASPSPGLALRIGAGWRFSPYWQLAAAWIRQGHRPGGSFSGGSSDGGMLAVRGIVPLATRSGGNRRVELGFELGLGWTSRVLERNDAPTRLASSGAVLRPAVVLQGWVLADLAVGLELAPQLNLHWRYCVDQVCDIAPGPWIGSELDQRFVDGFSLAVRATGFIFPRI